MKWRFLKYAAGFTIPVVTAISFLGEGAWTWVAIAYGFGLLPALELVLPSSKANLTEAEFEVVKEDKSYDALLWSMVFIQYGLLAWFLMDLSGGTREMCSMEWWGIVLAMGFSCSILGINVAHELGHRSEKHNQGHHRNVATKEDPGTARRNEWMQVFWFRAVFVAWVSAWQIEAKNMRRKGLSPWLPSNVFLRLQVLQWGY